MDEKKSSTEAAAQPPKSDELIVLERWGDLANPSTDGGGFAGAPPVPPAKEG